VPHFKDTLGWIYYLKRDYRAAISLLEEASRDLAENALVHYHLGMAYAELAQDERALSVFNRAHSLASNDRLLQERLKLAMAKLQPKVQP
jgi:tetratricopeptide (TPR) repeat protein